MSLSANAVAPLAERVAKGRAWLANLKRTGDQVEYDRLYPKWDALRQERLTAIAAEAERLDRELQTCRVGGDPGDRYNVTLAGFDPLCDEWAQLLEEPA